MLPEHSIHAQLLYAKKKLVDAGVADSPKTDAEILLAHALQKDRTYLYTWSEEIISADKHKKFKELLQQRLSGKPIAYIIGSQEFWGLNFIVNENTLIPRPDTETIIEETLRLIKKCQGGVDILDLGTGSGAIICSLKHELPEINAFAIDFDTNALKIAQRNAKKHTLEIKFLQSDWFKVFNQTDTTFDFIISNPPYIADEDPHIGKGDLRFEPISALTSGQDGLKDIRIICQQAPNYLNENGWLLIEHGYNQAKQVQELLQKNSFTHIKTLQDYANNDRISLGQFRIIS